LLAASLLSASETKVWSQAEQADFDKGDRKSLSLSSDGRLRLGPQFDEILDSSSVYLWALVGDSKGNLYAGGGGPGGPGARVYIIPPDGKGKVLAELDGLEVHALAVDKQDRIYAATSPDGKIYRLSASAKPEVFFDPKAKYIWGMVFDSHGNLFVATGDRGEIFVVTSAGQGKVFYKTPETHVRSMTIDAQENLIIGTEPGGLIVRVSAKGEGFVLYQAAKREITAVAVAPDGSIYATGVGNKTPGAVPTFGQGGGMPSVPPAAMSPHGAQPGGSGEPVMQRSTQMAGPPTPIAPVSIAGGSELYRIDKEGAAHRVWSHPQSIAYAIGFDAAGHPLIGTGNKGTVYRIDSPLVSTDLLSAPPTQVTVFWQNSGGNLFAATGNVGKVYRIGPAPAARGTLESDVLDAGMFSYWGRLSFRGDADGGRISIETRSGNLERPQDDWSPWSAAITSPEGARITSPSARFLQWRATLAGPASGESPELRQVDAAYLQKNVGPQVELIEVTPPNYRMPPQSQLIMSPNPPLTLPALTRQGHAPTPSMNMGGDSGAVSMQYAKGYIGARWLASDENGDEMTYTLEIKGEGETEWKPLKDSITEKRLTWDSTAFPDGEYRVRVTASDSPSNPPERALTARLASDPFTIDNTPPGISGMTAAAADKKINVRWHAADALSIIDRAEYSVNGGDWTPVEPTGHLSDSKEEDYALAVDRPKPGEYTIAVRVTDEYDNTAVAKIVVK
jgi:sugar lactone lactonase YvrE